MIRTEGIAILHTHGPRANLFGYFVTRSEKLIWTTTVHSDPRYDFIGGGLKGKLFTMLNLWVLKKVNHCFAISSRFSKLLEELHIKCPMTTIYNGISFTGEQQAFFSPEDFQLKKEDFVVIMVGRLHPIKGHDVVFEAIKKVKDNIPNLKLLIVGDGPSEADLKQKVASLNIDRHVLFLGFHPEEKIDSLLKLADVFLLSSYSESFPLVVLEAARAKIPVISTDVGGVADLIDDETLGWVIPPKSVASLEQAIMNAYDRHEELPAIGEKLHQKAATKYSINQLVEAVADTYRELLVNNENKLMEVSKPAVNFKER
ncbi:glycosyltransferase family 4 protein [Anaerobacillus sp. CMMVII]|uniref:glycosyltransferase family 4 protein n=1 Tax=Anaerobacillus sp. CMMVII TaxID=2755588 RepID=UPI0021B753FF|nr:glycosyltransferase family 4 protein [Anaerobacillus sp. CMMVII]MCT8140290.1 glycosyltransferase family 4 protein [Anaerobacillus sp. CMMVII]